MAVVLIPKPDAFRLFTNRTCSLGEEEWRVLSVTHDTLICLCVPWVPTMDTRGVIYTICTEDDIYDIHGTRE